MGDGEDRPEPPFIAAPVEQTAGFLDFLRATLLWKIEGLDDEQLRRPMTPSGVSLLAMIKHCAWVERWWFSIYFAGNDLPLIWRDKDHDADWRLEPGETADEIIAFYQSELDRSRAAIDGRTWDEMSVGVEGRESRNLGWVMSHMVEEVARHVGQADIMREAIDGATGE